MSAREPLLASDGRLPIFALEIDGLPVLAFETVDFAEALEICSDADLRADLMALKSNGVSVCSADSTLNTRPAAQKEIKAFEHAVGVAPASELPTMTFLIRIDGVMVVTVGPEQS